MCFAVTPVFVCLALGRQNFRPRSGELDYGRITTNPHTELRQLQTSPGGHDRTTCSKYHVGDPEELSGDGQTYHVTRVPQNDTVHPCEAHPVKERVELSLVTSFDGCASPSSGRSRITQKPSTSAALDRSHREPDEPEHRTSHRSKKTDGTTKRQREERDSPGTDTVCRTVDEVPRRPKSVAACSGLFRYSAALPKLPTFCNMNKFRRLADSPKDGRQRGPLELKKCNTPPCTRFHACDTTNSNGSLALGGPRATGKPVPGHTHGRISGRWSYAGESSARTRQHVPSRDRHYGSESSLNSINDTTV